MYHTLLTGIKDLLDNSPTLYASVQCGLGRPSAYPSASLWLNKAAPGSGKADPQEEATVMVQIQGYADDDTEQSYLDMLALVASTRQHLHLARLPGRGAQALVCGGCEAMRMEQGGPTVYLLTVQARVVPSTFSLT
jgi:hypothetical protein